MEYYEHETTEAVKQVKKKPNHSEQKMNLKADAHNQRVHHN